MEQPVFADFFMERFPKEKNWDYVMETWTSLNRMTDAAIISNQQQLEVLHLLEFKRIEIAACLFSGVEL